jgi:glycosyltransferase involved in cell wall biosynthesis
MSNHVDGVGGAETVTRGIAAGLSERGYPVTLSGISPAVDGQADLSALDIPVTFMSDDPDPGVHAPDRVRNAWRNDVLSAMRRLLREHRGGVLLCAQVWTMEHVARLDLDGVMAEGVRVVGQYHASYEAAVHSGDYARLSRTYRNIDRFLLLTHADAEQFRRKNFNNTGWMPNALPFTPDDEPSKDRERLVVAVARYDENKQLDHLVRAWAGVVDRLPGWRLELYGEGPLRGRLQALVDELGVAGSVRLAGLTTDVPGLLQRSSLLALSSRNEGMPLVLAEALASGVPVVSYDCAPGVREIVTDGVDGVLVHRDDWRRLGRELAALAEDDARRESMARAGRVSARRFDRAHVLDRWEDVIARVMR